MKPRTTSVFTPVNIGLIIAFSLLFLFLLFSLFAPIGVRLWVLEGYRAPDGQVGFETGSVIYTIEIEDRKVVGIKALNASLLEGEENASILFHYERAYQTHAVTIDFTHNDQDTTCTYTFADPWTGVTCDDIQLTDAEAKAIEDSVDIYKSILERHFDWGDVPRRNRP
jgi:hypothetical protein